MRVKSIILWICLLVQAMVSAQVPCDSIPIPYNTTIQKHMYRQAFRVPLSADSLIVLTQQFLRLRFGDLNTESEKNKWLFYYEMDTMQHILRYWFNLKFNDSLNVRCQWSFLLFDSLAISVIHQFEPLYDAPDGVSLQYYKTNQPKPFSRQQFFQSPAFCEDRKAFDQDMRDEMKHYAGYLRKQTTVIVDKKIEVLD